MVWFFEILFTKKLNTMYVIPTFPEKLKLESQENSSLPIITEKWRMALLASNYSGVSINANVIPFQTKEEEITYVLKEEERNSKQKSYAFKYIYLTFATRILTSVLYKGEKIKLEDERSIRYYLYFQRANENIDIHIVEIAKLYELVNAEKWGTELLERIKVSPNDMCLLHYNNSCLIYLEHGFVRVEDLRQGAVSR
jgi:hypothetical protein